MVQTDEFLRNVITTPEGWLLIAFGDGQSWQQLFFKWPEEMPQAIARAESLAATYNVYFSSYLFDAHDTHKSHVLEGTRTIQADLDHADINQLPLQPTILVESSPGRYQAYWVLTEAVPLETHERLSRVVTYSITDCDHSGWPIGRKLRLPNTLNYKYEVPKAVQVVKAGLVPIPPEDIDTLTPAPYTPTIQADDDWVDGPHDCETFGKTILVNIKNSIPASVFNKYDIVQGDRSAYLWTLMRACFKAGLDRDQVFCVAAWTANNKWRDLTVNSERELAKDIERARKSVLNNEIDTRAEINAARQVAGIQAIKKQRITAVAMNHLVQKGQFVQTNDEQLWYIPAETGRPTLLETHSDQLRALLDAKFGLNPSETEYQYVAEELRTHTRGLPPTGINASLSHYNHQGKALYVHMGGRDIAKVTSHNVDVIPQGSDNVIFPWMAGAYPFKLDDRELPAPWCELLFGNGSLRYLENMSEAEGIALLRVWFVFLLLRQASPSRPILALLGSAGSGKSTIFKKVYKLLYGDAKEVLSPTNQLEFDQSVANNPLVAVDNKDGPVPTWFLNALAMSAGTSDIERRKLFTDNDTFRMKRQAMVGLTAHDPRFARADVADRLLILSLARRPNSEFVEEQAIYGGILQLRSRIWTAIIRDIQRILASPPPTSDEIPHTRIQDFATTGYWIAKTLGIGPTFKTVIENINGTQRTFALLEDQLLIAALDKYVLKSKFANTYASPGAVWTALETYSDDANEFKRTYKNSSELSRKLWALYQTLSTRYVVDNQIDNNKGTRMFLFGARD